MSFELRKYNFDIWEKHTAITNLPIHYHIGNYIHKENMAFISVQHIQKYNSKEYNKVREYIIEKFNAIYDGVRQSVSNPCMTFTCETKDVFKVLKECGVI